METPFDPNDDFSDDFPPPGWEKMDADEKHDCAKAHLARLRQRRAELLQQGPDAAYFVEEIDRQIKPLAEAVAAVQAKIDHRDATFETYLQATADRVDATDKAYGELELMVEYLAHLLADEDPACPARVQLQEIIAQLSAERPIPKRTLAELEAELRRLGLLPPPPPAPPEPPPAA